METNTLTKPRNWNVLTPEPAGGEEWKRLHRGKWGGNDIASIMGVGFKSRIQLWGESTGKTEPEDISNEPYIVLGILLEPVVMRLYEREKGQAVLPTPGLVQHPELDYVAVTPDGLLQRPDGNLSIFSAKTFNIHKRKDWRVDVPLRAQIQAHAEMWVLGLDATTYAALCQDGKYDRDDEDEDEMPTGEKPSPLLWADRERREDLIQSIGEEVVAFRELVQRDIPPDPGSDVRAVKAIYPKETPNKVATLAAELELAWFRNKELAAMRTAAKKEQDGIKAKILVAMGDAHYGITPGNVVLRAQEYEVGPRQAAGYSARPLIQVKKIGA